MEKGSPIYYVVQVFYHCLCMVQSSADGVQDKRFKLEEDIALQLLPLLLQVIG